MLLLRIKRGAYARVAGAAGAVAISHIMIIIISIDIGPAVHGKRASPGMQPAQLTAMCH